MTTVAIVTDYRILGLGIERVLSQTADVRVVASVSTVQNLEMTGRQTDVVVADLSPYPIDTQSRLAREARRTGKVLVVTDWRPGADPLYPLAVVHAGVNGIVCCQTDEEEFLLAVQAVAAGSVYLCSELAPHVRTELRLGTQSTAADLPPREVEALRLLADGLTHRQISRQMGLTEGTVDCYVKRIRAKLNVSNKAELTMKAAELGYLSARVSDPGRRAAEISGNRTDRMTQNGRKSRERDAV